MQILAVGIRPGWTVVVKAEGKIGKVSRVSAVPGYSRTQYLSKSLCVTIFSESDFQGNRSEGKVWRQS